MTERQTDGEGLDLQLIVSGSVAAYKSLDLIRALQRQGYRCGIILSKNAHHFVTPLSLSSLSELHPRQLFFDVDEEGKMSHISLARSAGLIVVCPASASFLARCALALCDDLASCVVTTATSPAMFFPAMNPQMWSNPLVQNNITLLKKAGHQIVKPEHGVTACGEEGEGRLPDLETILDHIEHRHKRSRHLENVRVLVTAGPTREALDPVRQISNRSSGRQGYAIARALRNAGAQVVLVSGPCQLPRPHGLDFYPVESAQEMWQACQEHLPVNVAICCAAVADWSCNVHDQKIKRKDWKTLRWEATPDILRMLGRGKDQDGQMIKRPQLVIGFAAETVDLENHARQKLIDKQADWLLANDVLRDPFGSEKNQVLFLQKKTQNSVEVQSWPRQSKEDVATQLLEQIVNKIS